MMIVQKMSWREKMGLALGAVGAGFIALWVFIYLPKVERLKALAQQWQETGAGIHQIEQIMATKIRLETQRGLRPEFHFDEAEEENWARISDLAAQFDLKVNSLRSEPRTRFLDENSQEVRIEGKTCQKIRLRIEMTGRYERLIDYLDALKGSLRTYCAVERLQIRKAEADPKSDILNISLDLDLYVLS